MTLPELLVAMGLLGLLTTLISTTAILGIRSVDTVGTRLDDVGRGEVALANTTKWLRTAVSPGQLASSCPSCATTAVLSATPTRITFYANLGDTSLGPSLVTLEVVEDTPTAPGSGALQMTTQRPLAVSSGVYRFCDATTTGCSVVRRRVARGLVWPSPAVLSYRDLTGTPMSATVATANLGSISSVEVVLPVRSKTGDRYRTTTAVARVSLPNVELSGGSTS